MCLSIAGIRMFTQICGFGQLMFEQLDVRGQRLAAREPHPCLGDIGVGVETAILVADDMTVVIEHAEFVLILEQVLFDLSDLTLAETGRAIQTRCGSEVFGHVTDVGVRCANGVVCLVRPFVLSRDIERIARPRGASTLRWVRRVPVRAVDDMLLIGATSGILSRRGDVRAGRRGGIANRCCHHNRHRLDRRIRRGV